MTLTLSELEAVAAELDSVLSGGTVRDVRQADDATFLLDVEILHQRRRVLVSIRPRISRIHLTSREMPPPAPPTRFEARVRDDLIGTRIEHVRTLYRDRVIGIAFRRGAEGRGLIFECSGHHPNLYLADERTVVLAMMGPSHSHRRDLRPGHPYVRPLKRTEEVEALRFVPGPEGMSRTIEAHYAAEEDREARAGEVDRLRALLREARDRAGRLAAGLGEDRARAATAGDDPRGRRLAARLPEIDARLREVQGTIATLTEVHDGLGRPTEEAISRARTVLEAVRPEGEERIRQAAAQGPVPFRRFQAEDGTPILVGRGRRENLDLTFHVASDNDLWLHVEGAKGAHVVVPGGRQTLPFETILDAAILAVHFSEADPAREHVVTCTHRRNVRPVDPVRDREGGDVRVLRAQEVRVRPAPPRLDRLLAGEVSVAAGAVRPGREDRSQVVQGPRRGTRPDRPGRVARPVDAPSPASAGDAAPPRPSAPPRGRRRVVFGRGSGKA